MKTELADMENTSTRLIALGDSTLMSGFSLIGFETKINPSIDELDSLLNELMESRQSALVFLETKLSQCHSEVLSKVRHFSGNIIVTEIPAFGEQLDYHPYIDEMIKKNLGKQVLGDTTNQNVDEKAVSNE